MPSLKLNIHLPSQLLVPWVDFNPTESLLNIKLIIFVNLDVLQLPKFAILNIINVPFINDFIEAMILPT